MLDLNWEPLPTWDPNLGEQSRVAWQAMVLELWASPEAIRLTVLADRGAAAAGIQWGTAERLLVDGVLHGYLAPSDWARWSRRRDGGLLLTARFRRWLAKGDATQSAASP